VAKQHCGMLVEQRHRRRPFKTNYTGASFASSLSSPAFPLLPSFHVFARLTFMSLNSARASGQHYISSMFQCSPSGSVSSHISKFKLACDEFIWAKNSWTLQNVSFAIIWSSYCGDKQSVEKGRRTRISDRGTALHESTHL